MNAVNIVDDAKKWVAANKGVVQMSVVGGRGAKVTLDINGYEFSLSLDDGQWAIALDDDEDDAGMGKFVAHMMSYVLARKRVLGDVLKECQSSFSKHVHEEGSASAGSGDDDDGGDDDGANDEREYEKWVDEEPVKKPKKQPSDYIDAKQFNFPSIAKGAATQRLISDFAALKGSDTRTVAGFEAAPHNGNLYCWRVKIYPPPDSALYKDMKALRRATDAIDLEMLFPSEYPNDPPFIRVLAPRFALRSGHVTIGGSICMDLLTMSGWSPVNSIESVLIQIRTEMVEGGGRLDMGNKNEYTVEEAKAAFTRVAQQHGWAVPNMANLPWESALGK